METISVIMPAYNAAKFIAEALESIFRQVEQALEIIIVDDGSTDATAQIVATFEDPRVQYIFQKNSGVSAARNMGLRIARGDLIAFLDADDRWHPEMLKQQKAAMAQSSELAFCFTNFIRFEDGSNKILAEQFEFYPELSQLTAIPLEGSAAFILKGDAFSNLVSFGEVPGYTQAIIFRRKFIEGIFFSESLKICEDMEFVLRAAAKGSVAFNPAVLVEVRRHAANLTADTPGMAKDKLNALLRIREGMDLSAAQQAALNDRLIRAYIGAAEFLASSSRKHQSLQLFMSALAVDGKLSRKVKTVGRLALSLLRATNYGSDR